MSFFLFVPKDYDQVEEQSIKSEQVNKQKKAYLLILYVASGL